MYLKRGMSERHSDETEEETFSDLMFGAPNKEAGAMTRMAELESVRRLERRARRSRVMGSSEERTFTFF